MKKEEKKLIKDAREEMDENAISEASFQIQTILERVFQRGIDIGETIGYAKASVEANAVPKAKRACKPKASKESK